MQILRKTNLKAYEKANQIGFKRVIEIIKEKKLKGRGGAGFPIGDKWEMVANTSLDTRYVICNADEGEPGTFKDKFIIENNPELLVEGILIAAYAVGAEQCYIYLRGEYDYLEPKLKKVIRDILNKTKAKTKIDIVLGAGAYVCGDETAILESIEGKRGHPRHKPPYPTIKGLFGKATVINNVETLANVPLALSYNDYNPDLRLYSVSGNVKKPGVYEMPLGTNLCKLIEKAQPTNKVKAVYFGCFGGCIPYCDIPLTPEHVYGKECMLGACTIIVVDEKQSIVDVATNIAKFYEFESCGKCTPCREGTLRVLALLEKISIGKAKLKDLNTLQELAEVIKESSFCGLGQTATQHLLTALSYFREEFEAKCKKN
jgi:NADH:ubiquinone oxidoreductase subunit F (NADH-binding)